jgi:hypothetical protein
MTTTSKTATSNDKPKLKKLALKKETLRDLSGDKTGAVRGGARNQSQCSYDYSGCIN